MFVLYTLPEAQRTQGIKSITFLWLKSVWYNLKVNDTFGKWCRCLTNVCYLKLKKRRYLDKCRLSASAETSGWPTWCFVCLGYSVFCIEYFEWCIWYFHPKNVRSCIYILWKQLTPFGVLCTPPYGQWPPCGICRNPSPAPPPTSNLYRGLNNRSWKHIFSFVSR